jgi:hypothetical protein
MVLPNVTQITGTAIQGSSWFSDPNTLTMITLGIVIIILIIKIVRDTYKDITGQRILELDGNILTISRIKNDAIANTTITVGDRAYIIDHPAYRITTTLGVHLTIWLCDRPTGRTIGLNNPAFKVMDADEQKETMRAIPERMLGTVSEDKGLGFVLAVLGAGALLGIIAGKMLGI